MTRHAQGRMTEHMTRFPLTKALNDEWEPPSDNEVVCPMCDPGDSIRHVVQIEGAGISRERGEVHVLITMHCEADHWFVVEFNTSASGYTWARTGGDRRVHAGLVNEEVIE